MGAVILRSGERRGRQARVVVAIVIALLVSLVLSLGGSWAAVVGVGVNVVLLTLVALAPEHAGLRR